MIRPSDHRPTGVPPPSDEEHQRRVAWITKVRNLHRNKRLLGLAGILLGAALVAWSRFSPAEAPWWALMSGFVVLGLSWLVFLYVIVDRWLWVKRHPYKPGEPPPS